MRHDRITVGALGLGLVWLATAGAAEPVTLARCIQTALRENPDIRSASARVEAARAAMEEAASAYFPQIGLSGSWTRTDNPPQAFFMSLNQRRASLQNDFNNPEDTENARGSVIAQWRLYDSGRREADRQVTRLGARAAEYSRETVRNELVFQITKAYYGLLQARECVAVREDAVAGITENLRVAGERVKAGGALKTDVLNLDVLLSQGREDLIRASNGVHLARVALNAAIGKDLVGESDTPDLSGVSDPPTSDPVDRPEWRAVQAQVGMAEAMTRRARRDYLPVVNAFGSVDWDSEPFRGPERSYLAGAAVELNVFDGFRTRAGVARASAGLVAAQAEADKLRTMLALDLTRAQLAERESRERMEVAGKSLAAAEEALRITGERFRQGAAEVTELMTAQVGLTATRARQVVARYDNLIARADVKRARGQSDELRRTPDASGN